MQDRVQKLNKFKSLSCKSEAVSLFGRDDTKITKLFDFLLHHQIYHKFPKYSDTQKNCCNKSKIWTMWLYHRVMSPNDADGMANSVDPDQTAPLGAVWSGSALFALAYLSENLGSLWYGLFTYSGLLHSLYAFLIPPPQVLVHLPYGRHLPQPPWIFRSGLRLAHCPRMHHCKRTRIIIIIQNVITSKQCRPRSDCSWSGSTLFAIPSASFECITLLWSYIIQILGYLQQFFRCPILFLNFYRIKIVQLRIEIMILKFHWVMKNISLV